MISLHRTLKKALHEEPLSGAEVIQLLRLEDRKDCEGLFETARTLRDRYFGDKIFLYGFIYFSTWCRNNCTFCYYRTSNKLCERYRKTDTQIMEAVAHLAESGVHLLDLTMGEDPFYFGQEKGFEPLLRLVRDIKIKTGLPIMVSWGVLPSEAVEKLPSAGVDWLACYQETHTPDLFRKLRLHQDYHLRFQIKEKAKRTGLLIEEGILSGVGESIEDVAVSVETMMQMDVHQARVMSFIPQKGTPMSSRTSPTSTRENLIISVLRLLLPHRLIPASLDVHGINGLRGQLYAGANVVTSLIPPSSALRGVAQSTLGICDGQRSAKAVLPILKELGLRKASLEDYIFWINHEKRNLLENLCPAKGCSSESVHRWKKTAVG